MNEMFAQCCKRFRSQNEHFDKNVRFAEFGFFQFCLLTAFFNCPEDFMQVSQIIWNLSGFKVWNCTRLKREYCDSSPRTISSDTRDVGIYSIINVVRNLHTALNLGIKIHEVLKAL